MRDVSEALSKLECHHLLLILDCCFAGTFRWAGSRKAVPILETIRREHYYHFIRYPAVMSQTCCLGLNGESKGDAIDE